MEHLENCYFGPGETIQLDGKSFTECTFDGCEVIYAGGETSWERTDWKNCHFTLVKAANFTVQVLKALGCAIGAPPGNAMN